VRCSRRAGARLLLLPLLIGVLAFATSGNWARGEARTQSNSNATRERRVVGGRSSERVNTNAGRASASRTMTETDSGGHSGTPREVSFFAALSRALKKRGLHLNDVCPREDPVATRILEEYGAIFVATSEVRVPPVCIFTSEADVERFQADARPASTAIGGSRIELQPAALAALLSAREDAARQGLTITPRGGAEAARRGFQDTVRLWNSRFLPALEYWKRHGRLTADEANRLRGLPVREQVGEVLRLEDQGIFFSRDLRKSILYSVAAPGASQHIAMLAFDVAEFEDARVRRILAAHGWFQTVKSDQPHFTYLGLDESDLPPHGLRPVMFEDQLFWIPNVADENR